MRECRCCRFWSEMVAEGRGGDVFSLCLNPASPLHLKMTGSGRGCDQGKDAPLGAIDDGEPKAKRAAYERLDRMEGKT